MSREPRRRQRGRILATACLTLLSGCGEPIEKDRSIEESPASAEASHARTDRPAPAQEAGVQPGYGSPEEVAEAFIAATRSKDWAAAFSCFDAESRNLALAHLVQLSRFVAAMGDEEASLGRCFESCAFDVAAAETNAQLASSAEPRPGPRELTALFVESVADKEHLFVSLLTWLDESFGARGSVPATTSVRLEELQVQGGIATGDITMSAERRSRSHPVRFIRTDGRWLIGLTEFDDWDDVFLGDYLDAVLGWRL